MLWIMMGNTYIVVQNGFMNNPVQGICGGMQANHEKGILLQYEASMTEKVLFPIKYCP